MNCDHETIDFDAFLRWAAYFIEGGPENGNVHVLNAKGLSK